MTTRDSESSPFATLTPHFFFSFFRLSFLDDAGEESFKRAIIGVISAVVSAGLFVARLYLGRYAAVTDADRLALLVSADRLLIITLPMVVTTAVMALVTPGIFPDELDFRTLMALPVSRRTVFFAKGAALFLFANIFVVGANVAFALPLSLIVNGHTPNQSVPLANLCQLLVGLWAGAWAVAVMIALEGFVVAMLPRGWLRRGSIWVQTGTVAGVVLTIPFVLRIPGLGRTIAQRPTWLFAVPPAWFLGADEWLLGSREPFVTQLAALAVVGTAATLAMALACALTIYRRFDQSMLRPNSGYRSARWHIPLRWPIPGNPAHEAVRDFMSTTLRRSGLHQFVLISVCAVGAAMAVNALLGAIGFSERTVVRTALGTPFTLMAGAVVGLRTSLLLPTNVRAGWVFRFAEQAGTRPHQLHAVRQALFVIGVMWPTALALPVQIGQVGLTAAATLVPITLLIGWTFTEIVCLEWRRIPFTCTFLFAKRPPVYTVFLIAMIFGWFVFLSARLLYTASQGAIPWLVVSALVLAIGLPIRWYRLQNWGRWPLEFEDYLPDGLDSLRLGD